MYKVELTEFEPNTSNVLYLAMSSFSHLIYLEGFLKPIRSLVDLSSVTGHTPQPQIT